MTTSMLIRELVSQKGLKMTQFCKIANINSDKFCWHLTNNVWTLKMLRRVSKALGVDLTDFVTSQSEVDD